MINLALRSEYSFRQTFQHMAKITAEQEIALGLADINNTFGHVKFEKACRKAGLKPIFGVRLMVVKDVKYRPTGQQGNYGPYYILLAKNSNGLKEIYELTKLAWDNFYYRPHIEFSDLLNASQDIIVIGTTDNDLCNYLAINYSSPKYFLHQVETPKVFINDNLYPTTEDKETYQLMCGAQKKGNGYSYKYDSHTYPDHILSEKEFLRIFNDKSCIENTYKIAEMCEDYSLPKASMVRHKKKTKLEALCIKGAMEKGIDLVGDDKYQQRFEREIEMIYEKDYQDYFLNVAEIINEAKKKMLVGPARGSSAGSLVCYLCGITEVDPLKHDLIFERFIDITREDLPDIDIDFPDNKRDKVFKFIEKEYGKENSCHIATVQTFKPKTAIGEFAMGLGIPPYETEAVKGAIIERSQGDARAEMRIVDTLESTEIGRALINAYPAMILTANIEGHASHAGTHAAGMIICNEPITNFGGVNSRDGTIMMDKKDAEAQNLLKIDILGLRTLTILEDCAALAGFDTKDFYSLPLDDEKTFDVFNSMRLQGIFQFEGHALQFITRQIGVHEFNDIVAITSLARPGAMNSGGSQRYVKYKLGEEFPVYRGPIHYDITNESMGIVIYQEQMMRMAKEIGNMTWEDVSRLRKAASKSLGDEYFSQFKEKFIKGATEENGYEIEEAEKLWHDISATGSWTFNKSHAVSYGLISYWTAWCKAHYPLEFAAANLNNAKSDDSAVRLLRDMVENEGIEYEAFDPDLSEIGWSIANGKLLGGLLSVDGIGLKKAQEIVKKRKDGNGFTPGIVDKLLNPKTPFMDIFPCRTRYGELYTDGKKYGVGKISLIKNVVDKGEYIIIGQVKMVDLRDRNDYQSVVKRGGTYVDKNQFYLKMFIEDDTDSIMVMIPPHKFDELKGKHYAETMKVDHTWLLIKGSIEQDWRMISINAIHDITYWSITSE